MRRLRWLGGVAVVVLFAGTAQAQGNAKTELKAVEKALQGLPLGLRGYSADRVARFTWDGTKLVPEPTEFHALAVFATRSVKLEKDRIVLAGEWSSIMPGVKFADVPQKGSTDTKIEVDLHGGDPAAVLRQLRDGLFFADEAEQLDGVPGEPKWGFGTRAKPRSRNADGAQMPRTPRPPVTPPRVLRAVEPEFSEQARAKKIGGNVLVSLVVSDEGTPTDLWVVRGMGYGLDQQALKAVSQYQFQPGTSGGVPVRVSLNIDVNFQIF